MLSCCNILYCLKPFSIQEFSRSIYILSYFIIFFFQLLFISLLLLRHKFNTHFLPIMFVSIRASPISLSGWKLSHLTLPDSCSKQWMYCCSMSDSTDQHKIMFETLTHHFHIFGAYLRSSWVDKHNTLTSAPAVTVQLKPCISPKSSFQEVRSSSRGSCRHPCAFLMTFLCCISNGLALSPVCMDRGWFSHKRQLRNDVAVRI